MFVYVSRKLQPFNGSATVWLLHINLIKWARRLFRQAIKITLSLYIPSPRILRRGQKAVLNTAIIHYVHLGKPFAGRHDAVASCDRRLTGIPPERGGDPTSISIGKHNRGICTHDQAPSIWLSHCLLKAVQKRFGRATLFLWNPTRLL